MFLIVTALNEALTAEVRRLKLVTQDMSGDPDPSKGMVSQQHPINSQMFQLQQQQLSQLSIHQQQQRNGNTTKNPESNQ